MNLRKLSHQTYLQAKHKLSKKVIPELGTKQQNQETNVTVSDFNVSNHEKKLISDQRNNKRHVSPIFHSKNLIIETEATKKRFSLSREKIHSSNFSSLWDSQHSGKKQSIQQIQDNQVTISKGSQQKLEAGIKHQKDLDDFIKFKHQNTQTHQNEEKLKKFEKQKIKQKIKIELDIDQEIDQQNNEKSCQYNFQAQNSGEQKQQPNSPGSSKPSQLLPLHLRYQYEQEYKQAKSKKVEIKEENNKQSKKSYQFQEKVVTQDKIEEFIKEQEKYLQKKAEFFTKEYEKKLWQLQQTENEFQFKPMLNEESCRVINSYKLEILDKKQKGKKFQERQEEFQQNKQQKLDEQAQHAIPTFTPTISKKSKKVLCDFYQVDAKPNQTQIIIQI